MSGFRGFATRQQIDLDADAIVVVGSNGHGKTSLFDAILWALSGRIPRLGATEKVFISLYSASGEARVELSLRLPGEGGQIAITRSCDGEQSKVSLVTPDGQYQGASAEARIVELVWPDAAASTDASDALASVLTRSVYLQQDLVRHFVEAASDQERFAAVSALLGAGRVIDLQADLERAKKAWTTATNTRLAELEASRERLENLDRRVAEISGGSSQAEAIPVEAWTGWWKELDAVGVPTIEVEPASREAAAAIHKAIIWLEVLRRSASRRAEALEVIRQDVESLLRQHAPDTEPIRARFAESVKRLEALKIEVREEQSHQADRVQKAEQLKAMADLAIQNLGAKCPVCNQTYDRWATRRRLQKVAQHPMDFGEVQPGTDSRLTLLTNQLADQEKAVSSMQALLTGIDATEQQVVRQAIEARLHDLGVEASEDDAATAVARRLSDGQALLLKIGELQRTGESFAARLVQGSAAGLDELRRDVEILRKEVVQREREVTGRNRAGERAQAVIEGLPKATSAVVEQRLTEIAPLLQSIYSRVDPQPASRAVAFLSRVVRGQGRPSAGVRGPVGGEEPETPHVVLSSGQRNALAVCVFLASNIGCKPPLSVALLDDPLQSLDEVNLLGLVDLVRRAKAVRQICISTRDERLGALLARKLRPSGPTGRTVLIELGSWSRNGPVLRQTSSQSDPVRLRLVGSGRG
ncbi:MAG: AAA family ATPase [Thermoanaerobaculia bacterium]